MATPTGVASRTRLFFADHLRVVLIALVVVHHLTITFAFTVPGLWYIEDPTKSAVSFLVGGAIVLLDQGFFMGTFFLLSGYFTPASFDRKGLGPFLRDRVVRLLIPLVFFDLVLGPLTGLPAVLASHAPVTLQGYLENLDDPGPLWFVEVLFLLGCGYAVFRRWGRPAGTPPVRPPSRPPRVTTIALFILGLAVATFLFRLLCPLGYTLPILQLPTPGYLPQYVSFFVVGILAARRDWFRTLPDWLGWAGFATAGAVTVLLFVPAVLSSLSAGGAASFEGGLHVQAAAYALWDSSFSVSLSLGLLVAFRRWANGPTRLWNELSKNAYGVYVIHAPLIVWCTLPLFLLPWPPLLKLGVAIVVMIPVCYLVAGVVRRLPGVRQVL